MFLLIDQSLDHVTTTQLNPEPAAKTVTVWHKLAQIPTLSSLSCTQTRSDSHLTASCIPAFNKKNVCQEYISIASAWAYDIYTVIEHIY